MKDKNKNIIRLPGMDTSIRAQPGKPVPKARTSSEPQPRRTRNAGPWMTADQVAEYLALPSRKAVYEATRRGEIPCYRLGRRLRFRREELDAALLKQRGCASLLDEISSEA